MTHPTIMVTGGAGFIGSNFVHYLLRTLPGAQVVVFDTLTYAGNLENLADLCNDKHLSFVQGDICDRKAVNEVMRSCDWVINFAAETHVDRSIIAPDAFVITDVIGTFHLLEAAKAYHIQRFL